MTSYKYLLKFRPKETEWRTQWLRAKDALLEDLVSTCQLTDAQLQGTSALFWLPLATDMHAR